MLMSAFMTQNSAKNQRVLTGGKVKSCMFLGALKIEHWLCLQQVRAQIGKLSSMGVIPQTNSAVSSSL